jgi:sugar lactone lactonase YvrE
MAVIAGATYREGLATDADGRVYVTGVASGSVVPPTAPGKGLKTFPFPGIKVDADGRLYVRYV